MDFTLHQYTQLLNSFIQANFNFQSFEEYQQSLNSFPLITSVKVSKTRNPKPETQNPKPKTPNLILRHDVDLFSKNSLHFARIEASQGIKGTYYFRIVPESFNEKIILEIASLGHEIGYHYETMDTCKGDIDKAYDDFCRNLETFRKIVPVTTICMHGSPRSPYDNRDIWKKYNYRDLGIIGEPYFDIDFTKIAYYTDTGRMWDGDKYSVRDKIPDPTHKSSFIPRPTPPSLGGEAGRGAKGGMWVQEEAGKRSQVEAGWGAKGEAGRGPNKVPFPKYHKTQDIINALHNNTFPSQTMLTFHPQRWTDKPLPWLKELVTQSMKNIVKRWFFMQKNAFQKN